jgi:tyrosyl-tRNA synthetase
VDDADVPILLRRFTVLPMGDIKKMEVLEGQEINEAKKILAFEATKLCHGEAEAYAAATTAKLTFEEGKPAADLPGIEIDRTRLGVGISLIEILVETELVSSKSEARRLIEGGGVKCNGIPVTNIKTMIGMRDAKEKGYIEISAGRKKHVLIRLKD